jgi:L-2-hydroxyglutarate oxidase
LFVPQTGIVDYSVVARKYAEKLTEMGAEIVLGEEVVDVRRRDNPIKVIGNNHTGTKLAAVVCVGLQSDGLARKIEPDLPLSILPFRGEYF